MGPAIEVLYYFYIDSDPSSGQESGMALHPRRAKREKAENRVGGGFEDTVGLFAETATAPEAGKMRFIVLALCFALALSRPQVQQGPREIIPIIRYDRDGPAVDPSYAFSYETGNGITHEERGQPKDPESFVVQGSYSYTAPDGSVITVTYIADENGYRPQTTINRAG
ncbi:cuticle protein CP14.6-like [Oratosquilla oratoria]|uniref:cuticle protein CP14.6-like n=1 Tax=Oratosquilla oratoria TaxID=337810 RepID=UPI003F76EB6A